MLEQLNQNPAVAASLKAGQQIAPKLATTVLTAIALWLIAGAVWLWLPHPALPIATITLQQTATSSNGPSVNVNELIKRQLFGKANAVEQPKPQQATSDAPETRLNLKLSGIILSDTPEMSRALIADSSSKQKAYAIGDTIAGSSAELHEIHADHVVLERAGRYETLRLQKTKATSRTTSTSKSSSASSTQGSVVTELKSVREQILKDPSKAGDFIRVRPVYSKGQLKGYRIYPGKDRALFRQVGLRSGDLVTSINGQSLNDPQKAFTMLSTLSSASSISLELQRRGRTENVSVDLGS